MTVQLWTDKHKPTTLEGISGQGKTVKEVQAWLASWKAGSALFIHGPPGIGKTLLVETLARERDCMLVQLDASDERNKKSMEEFISLNSKSLSLFHKGKMILIDEADGISGRDRGAVPSVVKLIKESAFPVFIIANDPWKQKLKPLRNQCKMIRMDKVRTPSIEKRLREICEAEGLEHSGDSLRNLSRWAQGDMRSAITDMQMVCGGSTCITDEDMESLGFRERENTLFNLLPTIFHAKRLKVTSRAIWDSDRDPDEVLWWIEQNIPLEIKDPDGLIKAYDALSKADMFRSLVHKQQNWRMKAFMVDMMSGVSLFRGDEHGYVAYKPPKRFTELMKIKFRRAAIQSLTGRLSEIAHVSTSRARKDYLPYLRIIFRNSPGKAEGRNDYTLELAPEDVKILNS
jgi:replication factor C large subunit